MIIILLQGHRMSLSSSIKCHGDEQPRPILYQHPMSSEKLTCTTPISSLPNAAQSLFSFSTHLLLLLSPLLSWYILSTRELINRHCFSQSLLRLHLIFIHIFSTSFSSSPSSSSSSCSYSCFFFSSSSSSIVRYPPIFTQYLSVFHSNLHVIPCLIKKD